MGKSSFWTRIRWGKAVAAPGVRGQDSEAAFARNERKAFLLLGIQRERLAAKVQPGEARFGSELDGEKLWRHQVFGARMREKNGRKHLFFLEIQRQRLAAKVQPGGGSFWTRIRWGKAVAARESATRGGSFRTRIR